jgi:hypothetical protein
LEKPSIRIMRMRSREERLERSDGSESSERGRSAVGRTLNCQI